MTLPSYNVAVDELRIALTYVNKDVVFTPISINVPKVAVSLLGAPTAAKAAATATAAESKAAASKTKTKSVAAKDSAAAEKTTDKTAATDDDDFDVFGDDAGDNEDDAPKESREEMMARLKKEAEERTAKKEAKQRTLVAVEIKPWDVEQDLMALWKKVTTTVVQDGLKWGENCTLADVAFGIKKIQCTFVMGVNNSSDDVIDKILEMEDEVQSAEVTSMNVL